MNMDLDEVEKALLDLLSSESTLTSSGIYSLWVYEENDKNLRRLKRRILQSAIRKGQLKTMCNPAISIALKSVDQATAYLPEDKAENYHINNETHIAKGDFQVWLKSSGADKLSSGLLAKWMDALSEEDIDEKIRAGYKEVERLYEMTKRALDEGIPDIKNPAKHFKKETLRQYDLAAPWGHISKEHLDILYVFASGQRRRDFRERVLERMTQETGVNLPKAYIRKCINTMKG